MKKLTLFFLLCSSILLTYAQSGKTTVNGILRLPKMENIYMELYRVRSGTIEKIDSTKELKAGDSTFTFTFKPAYKGYYVVGVAGRKIQMIYPDLLKARFYAKGNDVVNVVIASSTAFDLPDNNTKENQLLGEWNRKLSPLTTGLMFTALQFPEVYVKIDSVDRTSKLWLKGVSSGNPAFDALLRQTVPNDIAMYATRYVSSARRPDALWEKKAEDFKEYVYNTDFKKLLQDTFILKLPFGTSEMATVINTMRKIDWLKGDSSRSEDYYKKMASYIPNPVLKGIFLTQQIRQFNSYEKLEAFSKDYAPYLKSPVAKKALAAQMAKISEFKKGTPGFDFSYPDVNGNKVAFSSLKGKVVLIDVWATWCAPCREQLPHLKALEEEFKDNKDIVFVGLSSDEDVNAEKWKTFVKENQLPGIQIKADGGMKSKFSTIYKVNGIPRFMVFDKQGRVVTIDAPRPSQPELKELLLKTLAGK